MDAWYAVSRVHQRQRVRGFLTWAIDTGRLPTKLTVPVVRFNTGRALTQQRRLELLHRYLHDTDTPTATRAAVCLLLLFAQPLSRILRLTVDDITYDDHGDMLLRLGEPPTPVSEPFADLLADLVANREYLGGVANPTCRWLFPGRRPGHSLTYQTVLRRLRQFGFPAQQARASAVRELVLQVPAPVVAAALGSTRPPPPGKPPTPAAPGIATRRQTLSRRVR